MSLPLQPKHTESQRGRVAPSAPPNYDWWSFHLSWRHRGTRRQWVSHTHTHKHRALHHNKHSLLSHKLRWQITPQQRTALKPFVCLLVWITFVKLYLSVCSVYLSSCHTADSLSFFYHGLTDSWHSSCCFHKRTVKNLELLYSDIQIDADVKLCHCIIYITVNEVEQDIASKLETFHCDEKFPFSFNGRQKQSQSFL